MEDQFSPLTYGFYFQHEVLTEEYPRHSLLYTNTELEKTIICANEELAAKQQQLMHLESVLTQTVKERDDAKFQCETLKLQNLLLQQQLNKAPTNISNIQQEVTAAAYSEYSSSGFSSSDDSSAPAAATAGMLLPERGKFLQAVMEAGPLLQTLLLAGPLPEWQHPPPQLSTADIPPVRIDEYCLLTKRKRLE